MATDHLSPVAAKMPPTHDPETPEDVEEGQARPLPTPPQSENSEQAAPRRAGRPKGAAASNPKTTVRPDDDRVDGSRRDNTDGGPTRKRSALRELPNAQTAAADADEGDDDDFDVLSEKPQFLNPAPVPMAAAQAPAKKGRKAKAGAEGVVKKAAASRRRKAAQDVASGDEVAETEVESATSSLARSKPKGASRAPRPARREVIPETQPDAMDADPPIAGEQPDFDQLEEPEPPTRARKGTAKAPVRVQPSTSRQRAGSASDTERGGHDSGVRRKLNDMTHKFEALEVKYRDLRELSVLNGESNFEKLKKQTDDRAAGKPAARHLPSLSSAHSDRSSRQHAHRLAPRRPQGADGRRLCFGRLAGPRRGARV